MLLSAGVERGYWPDTFARAQKFVASPVIVTPDATDTDITEVRLSTQTTVFMCKLRIRSGSGVCRILVGSGGLWDVRPTHPACTLVLHKHCGCTVVHLSCLCITMTARAVPRGFCSVSACTGKLQLPNFVQVLLIT